MIIRRYLFREVGQSFGAVLLILLLVYVSFRFVRFFAQAAAGRLAADAIFELLGLKLIVNLGLLLPLALYLAVLLALGRLHRDSEIVALTAGGYGVIQVAISVLWLALGIAAASAALSLYVAPALTAIADDITKTARNSTQISGILPGRFQEYGDDDRVFYVETVHEDRRSMSNIFVQVRAEERLDVLFSERARHEVDPVTGDRFMIMEQGRQYQGSPGDAKYSVTEFERYGVLLDSPERIPGYRSPEAMSTSDLLASDELWHIAELHWRFSLPLSTVLLAMLAVPLARAAPGEGRVWKLFTGVLVYFVYHNMLSVAQKSIESGALSPVVGVWPVHGGLAVSVIAMILYQQLFGWRTRRWLYGPWNALGRSARAASPRRKGG